MAEAIFNRLAEERGLKVRAVSFGLAAVSGMKASANSVKACEEIGIDLSSFRTNFIYDFDLSQFERLYCMTPEHKTILEGCGVEPEMIEVLGMPDPFGGNIEKYRECRDAIYNSVKEIIEKYANSENDGAAP